MCQVKKLKKFPEKTQENGAGDVVPALGLGPAKGRETQRTLFSPTGTGAIMGNTQPELGPWKERLPSKD